LRFRQIALNLMSNAVKFTAQGGVRVSLAEEREGGTAKLKLEVEDTGEGISPDELPKLFDNYSQLDSAAGRRGEGSGLGLAISQRLAKLMGGSLQVRSRRGQGSTFWLELQMAEAPERVHTDETSQLPSAPKGKPRILVVEDNTISQKLAVRMLQKLGCEAETASDGASALAQLAQGGWDAVLMDWRLPDSTGLEVTRELRRREGAGPHVPVIALTANAMQGDREACLEAGMSDYLTKPIELMRLREAIDRWSRRPTPLDQGT
jgi:CheY-like chemotaxis protein